MVFKTTVSISRLTSFSRFGKQCFLARDIFNSLSFFMFFHFTFYRISLARKHRFPNREKLVNREIETVVLNTINPLNSKKLVTTFSWIFHFSLVDFSEKIYEIFFHQWAMLLGYMKEYMGSKKPKASFWESYRRLQSWPHYIDRTVVQKVFVVLNVLEKQFLDPKYAPNNFGPKLFLGSV